MTELGTIRGQLILDVKQALAAYTTARQAHISTVTALHTGAGAMIASGTAIAGVGAAMAAGLIAGIGAAAEFERKLDFFNAVAATTEDQLGAVTEKALELGEETIYSANQIADSFVELAKSGVLAEDIINGIGEGVAALGAAADIPLDTAANIITAAVATFGLGADQAVMVADKLAGAANASIVEVEDLGVSLKYAGGVASALGIEFEELNTALAILGINGIKGSTAGTSLRQILVSLTGRTPKATAALRDLGIITEDGTNQFFNMDGSLKSLAEVMEILRVATKGMGDEQRIATLQNIFAVRALPSLIALTKEGADGFSEMADAINKTTALDVASARLDNLSGDIEILRGNIDTLLIRNGTGFQDFARGLVQGVTNIIQAFTDLPNGVQKGILIFIAVASVGLILIGTLGLIAGSIMNLIALSLQLAPALGLLSKAYASVRTAVTALTAAQWGFNAAAVANPVGLIIAAVVLLIAQIAALIIYWEDFKNFIGSSPFAALVAAINPILGIATAIAQFQIVLEKHKTEVDAFFASVSSTWNSIIDFFVGIGNSLASFGNTIWTGITTAFNAIVTFFSDTWNNIVTGISNFILSAITFFQELPAKILQFFQELPAKLGYILGFILGVIVRFFLDIGTWVVTNVPIIINSIVTFFAELPAKIAEFFVAIYTAVVTWLQGAWDWLVTNVPLIIQAVITFFQELPEKIAQFFIDVYNNIITWIQSAWAWLTTNVPLIINNVITFFQQLPLKIAQFFIDIYNNVRKWLSEALQTAISLARDIFNNIVTWLNKIPETVKDIFNRVVDTIRGVITSAVNAVRDFASGMWEGFKDGLGIHSPSYIEEAMWAITGVVGDETKRMKSQVRTLQGLGNNISEIGNNLGFSGVEDLYSQLEATRSVQSQLAIASTSIGVESRAALTMDDIKEALSDLTIENNFDVDINNPSAEPASDSLPKAIRKTTDFME